MSDPVGNLEGRFSLYAAQMIVILCSDCYHMVHIYLFCRSKMKLLHPRYNQWMSTKSSHTWSLGNCIFQFTIHYHVFGHGLTWQSINVSTLRLYCCPGNGFFDGAHWFPIRHTRAAERSHVLLKMPSVKPTVIVKLLCQQLR